MPGAQADGTIPFTLVKDDCTTLAASDNPLDVNPEDVDVPPAVPPGAPADGDYRTSGFTPDAPGDYHWKAVYSGSLPNTNGASHNDDPPPGCTEAGEDVTVEQIPTVTTTRQFVFPQDKVKIDTNPTGQTLSGNVKFRLFESTGSGATAKTALQNCEADDGSATATGLVYDPASISISGAGPRFATTNNQTYRITDGRTYVWRVIYTSSTQSQLGSSSNCTENTTVTFNGNDSSIDIP